ncbi:MAG: pentapeptide repeat-containing protein [Lachnospiraceae bacterium]|jgi:hypothetical protein
MSEITKYLSDYLQELDSYMKRLEGDGLSRKDRKLFFELSNEYYDIFQKAIDFPDEVLRGMSEFSDNIVNQSDEGKNLAKRYRDNIVQHADDYINASQRNELQFGIFQRDAEISSLQYEKMQMMQELVNLELKMYGQITEQTQDILDVQNYEILNGRVRELAPWEQNDPISELAEYQDDEVRDIDGKKEGVSVEKKRVLSRDELDQILNNHFMENRAGHGKKMLDLTNCIISNYVFKGDMSSILFDRSELRYCEFRMTKAENISLQNAVLSDCKMTQAEFDNCNFSNADINAAKVANSMFRGSSFDTAYMRQCSVHDSVFYHTTFTDTRMREFQGSENIFHECGNPADVVRVEAALGMDQEETATYAERLREMFNNGGYVYSWRLDGVDMENYAADLSVKISHDGDIVEEEKYSALLNPDTYEISHIDAGRQGDSLIRMFIPEMNPVITKNLQEKIKEQGQQRVRLRFPYMTRDTFMSVKDEIKRMGAKFDPAKKEWYVEKSVGQDVINDITSYLEKHDEAIYLKLPFTEEAQKFRQIIEEIKQNGARYNPLKKRWYITEGMDRSKFFSYLPTSEYLFWKERENHSVHEKLSGFKAEAEKQHTDTHEVGDRRKEAPERE